MNNKLIYLTGILGVGLFVVSSFVGGYLIEDYSILSQYISETYAIDAEYGVILRAFGFIPSGVFLTLFCFIGVKYFHYSKLVKIGFYGLGIFYGLATVIVSIFPCDSGCNKEFVNPSISQVIHNLTGFLTYVFVPFCMILVGVGLKRSTNYIRFSAQSIIYGIISILFVYLFFTNPDSEYIGLYQRMVEAVFIIWIITCAITIKNNKPASNNTNMY